MTVIGQCIKKVYGALTTDSEVQAHLGTSWLVTLHPNDIDYEAKGVYDKAPTGDAMPYIVFGNSREEIDHMMNGDKTYHVFMTMFVWTGTPNVFDGIDVFTEVERILEGTIALDTGYALVQAGITKTDFKRQSSLVWYVELQYEMIIQKVN